MFDMKMLYLIILLMFFSFVCEAKDKESISDSIEIVSQIKADKVLSAFDSIKAAKLLYSIEDKYYYVIIQVSTLYYKEFFHCCPEKFYHSVSCLGPSPSGTLVVMSV